MQNSKSKSIPSYNKLEGNLVFKIDRFKKTIRKTKPHMHENYLEMIYLVSGSGKHTIDTIEYKIKPPVLFVIRRDQTHNWDMIDEPEGYVLIFKKNFLQNYLDQDLRNQLFLLSQKNTRYLRNSDLIDKVLELLLATFLQETPNFTIQSGFLKVFFEMILSTSTKSLKETKQIQGKANIDIFEKFLLLLSDPNFPLKNQVAYYAKKLQISPQRLNYYCRQAKQSSATEIISDHILQEAKRLLLYSESSIQEISRILQFQDSSHFVKFFKRLEGQTPGDYRKKS